MDETPEVSQEFQRTACQGSPPEGGKRTDETKKREQADKESSNIVR